MKKIIYSVALISFISLLFSCGSGNVEKDIIGKWQVKEVKLQNMDELIEKIVAEEIEGEDVEQAEIDELKQEIKEELKRDFVDDFSKEVKEIEFKDDNTVVIGSENGKWSFNDDKTIVKINFDEEVFDFEINSISSSALDITFIMPEDGHDFKIQMNCEK